MADPIDRAHERIDDLHKITADTAKNVAVTATSVGSLSKDVEGRSILVRDLCRQGHTPPCDKLETLIKKDEETTRPCVDLRNLIRDRDIKARDWRTAAFSFGGKALFAGLCAFIGYLFAGK